LGVYIGDIWIPFVENFDIDDGERTIQVIKHIDKSTPPHFAEFNNPILTANLNGTLIQQTGNVKTANNYAEDVVALLNRTASDNYINLFQGKSGWLVARSASAPIAAETPLSRDYNITGNFLPSNIYQSSIKTNPVIISNPWSYTLGSDNCDNYIAVPIGATYTGGDGSTISQVGEDGTIVSVLATTNNIIKFDVAENDVDNGEVQVYDDMNGAEATWVRVHNPKHTYTGSVVIQNSLYRIIFDNTGDEFALYAYHTAAWNKLDDFTCGAFNIMRFMALGTDSVEIKVNSTSTITLERGKPMKIDTTTANLFATTITVPDDNTTSDNYIPLDGEDEWAASTAYALTDKAMPTTANGYRYEVTVAGTSGATEPTWPTIIGNTVVDGTVTWECKSKIVLYVAGTAVFATISATKSLGAGIKWLFYDTSLTNAVKVAHRALVNRNYRRELVER